MPPTVVWEVCFQIQVWDWALSSHKCDSQITMPKSHPISSNMFQWAGNDSRADNTGGQWARRLPCSLPGTVLRLRHGSSESLISSGPPPHAWRKSQVIASKSQVVLIIMCFHRFPPPPLNVHQSHMVVQNWALCLCFQPWQLWKWWGQELPARKSRWREGSSKCSWTTLEYIRGLWLSLYMRFIRINADEPHIRIHYANLSMQFHADMRILICKIRNRICPYKTNAWPTLILTSQYRYWL